MHILFLSNYWPPEIGASSHLTFELGETLAGFGHRVTVVTGLPSYNIRALPPQYCGRLLFEEESAGMRVLRVSVPSTSRGSKLKRGLGHLMVAPLYALRALLARDVDLVFTVSPPLPMALSAWVTARRLGVPYCLSVQDLFPQNAVDLGLMRNRAAIQTFEAMERFAYRTAGAVTVISDGNRQHVESRGANPARVHVVPNWVDTEFIRPGSQRNAFRQAAELNGEFVVLFAGTMGWSQGLGVAVEAARLLAAESGLVFLLVGDGVDRANTETMASGLPNVRFLPMQPKERYPSVLAAADACLVTLRPEVSTPAVPSKLMTIMAAGRPVLASMPLSGDAPRIVEESGAGIACQAGDARSLANAVLYLKRNPGAAATMARNGRVFAERHFSRNSCVREFERVFEQTAGRRQRRASA
jgi:glycosyltransferase involved in cell wall biosynthesis